MKSVIKKIIYTLFFLVLILVLILLFLFFTKTGNRLLECRGTPYQYNSNNDYLIYQKDSDSHELIPKINIQIKGGALGHLKMTGNSLNLHYKNNVYSLWNYTDYSNITSIQYDSHREVLKVYHWRFLFVWSNLVTEFSYPDKTINEFLIHCE